MKRAMGGRQVGGTELNHDQAKAELEQLIKEKQRLAKIELLEHLMTSNPRWTYDAAKDILIDLKEEDRIAELENKEDK